MVISYIGLNNNDTSEQIEKITLIIIKEIGLFWNSNAFAKIFDHLFLFIIFLKSNLDLNTLFSYWFYSIKLI